MPFMNVIRAFKRSNHQSTTVSDCALTEAVAAFRQSRQNFDARMLISPHILQDVIAPAEDASKGLQSILNSVRFSLFDKLVTGEAIGFSAKKGKSAPRIIYFSNKDRDDAGFFYPATTLANEILDFICRKDIQRSDQDKKDACLFLKEMQVILESASDQGQEHVARLEDMHPMHSNRPLNGYTALINKFSQG